ncbi:MAG: hypothetical protein AAB553_05160 [Patescibacteria group bacterium]
MLKKELQDKIDGIPTEALHILAISGMGKDAKDTYERAKATLGMLDIAVRMLISEMEQAKISKTKQR